MHERDLNVSTSYVAYLVRKPLNDFCFHRHAIYIEHYHMVIVVLIKERQENNCICTTFTLAAIQNKDGIMLKCNPVTDCVHSMSVLRAAPWDMNLLDLSSDLTDFISRRSAFSLPSLAGIFISGASVFQITSSNSRWAAARGCWRWAGRSCW